MLLCQHSHDIKAFDPLGMANSQDFHAKIRQMVLSEASEVKDTNPQMKLYKEVRIVHNCDCDGIVFNKCIKKLEKQFEALKLIMSKDLNWLDGMQREFDQFLEKSEKEIEDLREEVADAFQVILNQDKNRGVYFLKAVKDTIKMLIDQGEIVTKDEVIKQLVTDKYFNTLIHAKMISTVVNMQSLVQELRDTLIQEAAKIVAEMVDEREEGSDSEKEDVEQEVESKRVGKYCISKGSSVALDCFELSTE